MTPLFQSKAGIISVAGFVLLMAFVGYRVVDRRSRTSTKPPASRTTPVPSAKTPANLAAVSSPAVPDVAAPKPSALPTAVADVAENAAYLDQYYALSRRTQTDRDRLGNPVTRRQNANTPAAAGHTSTVTSSEAIVPKPTRAVLRLQGRPGIARPTETSAAPRATAGLSAEPHTVSSPPTAPAHSEGPERARPSRFNPYGRVIKCELVFTLDSTNEQTPLIGVVMEPVYNNGALVIPARAEMHGVARADRLRDRIFSGEDWVLVFPRENGRPNGRQLNVRGVALDRVEPDANGMTWGITDGSYGLEGKVIRTLRDEEIKRFVANFLGASTLALQDRSTGRGSENDVRNTPRNALLSGVGANFQKMAADISAEIQAHGVFIRVPAGHQFYFYPMQIIDPDVADISHDVAIVK